MTSSSIPVVNNLRVAGNPTLSDNDGNQAPVKTLLNPGWDDAYRARFGLYLVDTTPPEGKRWTGAFEDDGGEPVAVFEDLPPPSAADVEAERNRRLNADFEFGGKMYQRDRTSLQRITGAATLAGFAIANGALAGDLRWADSSEDFAWIASDNSVVTMDAQTCFAFGQAAANIETAIIFAAKTLRDMDPIPDPETWEGWP
ncbi:MAG: hypothetical protein ABJG14_11040 [Sulfitobacter sp.]|uniref:DUF4376 domain-containing protein n=1 Tax=Alphaproteobacteria TaxID=28211 RepID=UPI003265816F